MHGCMWGDCTTERQDLAILIQYVLSDLVTSGMQLQNSWVTKWSNRGQGKFLSLGVRHSFYHLCYLFCERQKWRGSVFYWKLAIPQQKMWSSWKTLPCRGNVIWKWHQSPCHPRAEPCLPELASALMFMLQFQSCWTPLSVQRIGRKIIAENLNFPKSHTGQHCP